MWLYSSMKGWKEDDVRQREANLTFTAGVCLRSGPACQPMRGYRAAGGGRRRLPPHRCCRPAPATPGTAPAPCASQGRGAAPDGMSDCRPAERQLLTDETAAAHRTGRTDAAGRQQGAQAACANQGRGQFQIRVLWGRRKQHNWLCQAQLACLPSPCDYVAIQCDLQT